MKTYLLTVHVGFNFGSSLQTIATSDILKRYSNDVIILNYHPKRVTYKGFFIKMFSSPKDLVKGIFSFPNYVINRHVYYTYLRKHVCLSKKYYSDKELVKANLDGDIFITGSDQVWNSKYNNGVDTVYFWNFLSTGKYIISLSSSFGCEKLQNDEFGKVKDLLSKYSKLSVREDTAQRIIGEMGYTAEHLLDPTLLLCKSEWKRYLKKRIIKEPYLLVYTPYNIVSKEMIYNSARLIANKYGLKIVTFSWTYLRDSFADRTIFYASPSDFLTLMEYANCVITNSFHGTAFSINLNKNFWIYNPSGFSTRIESLINMLGLNNRLLDDVITDSQINSSINYEPVNRKLEHERAKAFLYLDNALNT